MKDSSAALATIPAAPANVAWITLPDAGRGIERRRVTEVGKPGYRNGNTGTIGAVRRKVQ